jgi:hypothetical protein
MFLGGNVTTLLMHLKEHPQYLPPNKSPSVHGTPAVASGDVHISPLHVKKSCTGAIQKL